CANHVSHLAKCLQSLRLRAGRSAWVRKAPMLLAPSTWKEGALLRCVVADGHNQVERLALECVQTLRIVSCSLADVDAELGHRADRQRMHRTRVRPSTEGGIMGPAACLEPALGHLRARRVVRTEEEDAVIISGWHRTLL